MRTTTLFRSTLIVSLFALPIGAFAHEHQTLRIGDSEYAFTVGSLNEPVTVDDKTGVELSVFKMNDSGTAHDDSTAHEEEGAAVLGLEKTLQVELIAGEKKKTLPFTTQYGKPGAYKAVFFPTVATTLSYRVFGTLEGTAIDVTFTCNPAGHPATPEDSTETPMGEGVTRIYKTGSFGCPAAKADLGFPEPSVSLQELGEGSQNMPNAFSSTGGAMGIAALALSIVALVRTRKRRPSL